MDDLAFCLLILAVCIVFVTVDWVIGIRKRQKERVKSRASKPVDLLGLTYDKKAEIKQLGHELRKTTWKRRA